MPANIYNKYLYEYKINIYMLDIMFLCIFLNLENAF